MYCIFGPDCGQYGTVGGGESNTASGYTATVPGGYQNTASDGYSFAAGRRAKAIHLGTFVWADNTDADFTSAAVNQFLIRAGGGVGIGTTNPSAQLGVLGNICLEAGADRSISVAARPLNDIGAGYKLAVQAGTGRGAHNDYQEGGTLHLVGGYAAGWGSSGGVPGGDVYVYPGRKAGSESTIDGNVILAYTSTDPRGNVGIGRIPTANELEVEGNASKTSAGSWLANSDARIKTDVRSLENALDVINQLRPVQFKYTDEYRAKHPSVDDRYYVNYIAQEFQRVFPDDVKNSGEDNLLQIDTHPAVIYAVAAIQELHEKTRELDEKSNRIEQLEAQMAEMQAVLQQLLAEQQ